MRSDLCSGGVYLEVLSYSLFDGVVMDDVASKWKVGNQQRKLQQASTKLYLTSYAVLYMGIELKAQTAQHRETDGNNNIQSTGKRGKTKTKCEDEKSADTNDGPTKKQTEKRETQPDLAWRRR